MIIGTILETVVKANALPVVTRQRRSNKKSVVLQNEKVPLTSRF